MGRPGGAGQHRFTRGDGVGEVAPQEQVSEETCSEGEGEWKQNRKQTQEIVIQVDIRLCDASHDRGCHLHVINKMTDTTEKVQQWKWANDTVDHLYFDTCFINVDSLKMYTSFQFFCVMQKWDSRWHCFNSRLRLVGDAFTACIGLSLSSRLHLREQFLCFMCKSILKSKYSLFNIWQKMCFCTFQMKQQEKSWFLLL